MKQLLTLIGFLLGTAAMAQIELRIENGAHFISDGSCQLVINNGTMMNEGSFEAGQGKTIFEGDAPSQNTKIGGASFTRFHDLVISKSANDVILDGDIAIDNDLIFETGLLDLFGHEIELGGKILGETGTSRLTGGNGGGISKTLPMNIPINENPGNLGLEISSSEDMGVTIIRRSHTPEDIDGELSIERVFEIIPAVNENLNATLRIHYFDEELAGNPENTIQQWHANGMNWDPVPTDLMDENDNWIETQGIQSMEGMTLAQEANLPIVLISFEATLTKEDVVDLSWTTANEQNNKMFVIQRSFDGIDFEDLIEVDGAGNSYETKHYYTQDAQPRVGLNYYRLKQIDFDGNFSYSQVEIIELESKLDVEVFPNPFIDELRISGLNAESAQRIILISEGGHEISNQAVASKSSHIQISGLGDLPSGNYTIVIETSIGQQAIKLVKLRD